MSILKNIKYSLDIDNTKMNTILINIYRMIEMNFQNFVEKYTDTLQHGFDFKSTVEIVTYLAHHSAPKCTKKTAVFYAKKYMNNYINNTINIEMTPIIKMLSLEYDDIFIEYMNFLQITDNIKGLRILQHIIISHIITINDQYAYNNRKFENNIYLLTLELSSKLTKYSFFDKYSGVKFPDNDMYWSYKITNKNDIHTTRFEWSMVMLGFIEFIIQTTIAKNTVTIHK